MDGRTLTRMRAAFVALGVVLLLPLALLVRSASARLEEQRRLKHEVVAERIFDELERELAALLERERERSSDAYAATNTRPSSWAPFVVGYFVHDAGGTHVTARDMLPVQRGELVASAAKAAWDAWAPAHPEAPLAVPEDPAPEPAAPVSEKNASDEKGVETASKGGMKPKQPNADDLLNPYSKQETVLRKLNRAQAGKRRAPSPENDKDRSKSYQQGDDPLAGMDDL